MWPYTECEWNYITHGKRKKALVISKLRKYKTLVLMSLMPSLVLTWILVKLLTL